MTSRELIAETLSHRQADRVPLDLGGCGQTGMQVSTVYKLRQALKLDPPGTPDEIRREVRGVLDTFGPGGGYVFNTIHNVQHGVPVENLIALYETVKSYRF